MDTNNVSTPTQFPVQDSVNFFKTLIDYSITPDSIVMIYRESRITELCQGMPIGSKTVVYKDTFSRTDGSCVRTNAEIIPATPESYFFKEDQNV